MNFEAFKSRGNDPRMSHDFEEIIYIIDNNLNLIEDVINAEEDVQRFLKEMSKEILSHSSRNEIIECHIDSITMEERRKMIIDKLEKILELE